MKTRKKKYFPYKERSDFSTRRGPIRKCLKYKNDIRKKITNWYKKNFVEHTLRMKRIRKTNLYRTHQYFRNNALFKNTQFEINVCLSQSKLNISNKFNSEKVL